MGGGEGSDAPAFHGSQHFVVADSNPNDTFAGPSSRTGPGAVIDVFPAYTGFRVGFTKEKVLSLDGPTQKRNYRMPSKTARRDVPPPKPAEKHPREEVEPSSPEPKRSRSSESASDETLSPPPASSTTSNLEGDGHANDPRVTIERRRRQNTLAARRSRMRKMELVESLKSEAEEQRRRAEKAEEDLARALVENAALKGQLNREKRGGA